MAEAAPLAQPYNVKTFGYDDIVEGADKAAQADLATDYARQTQDSRIANYNDSAATNMATNSLTRTRDAYTEQLTRSEQLARIMAQPQTAQEWDDAMQEAADNGMPEAKQYIGRYNPERQAEWVNSLSAPTAGQALAASQGIAATPSGDPMAGLPGMPGGDAMAARLQGVDPKQYPAIAQHLASMRQAIEQVKNSADPAATFNQLAPQFGQPPLQPGESWQQRVAKAEQAIIPMSNYLGALQLQANAGLGAPQAPVKLENVGGNLYGVGGDPAHPTASLLATGGTNSRSSVFEQKKQAWLDVHPGDAQGALDYASGKKQSGMGAADMRKAADAQAARDLQAATLAGQVVPDTNAYLKQASDAHFAEMQNAQATERATPGGASTAAQAPANGPNGYTAAQWSTIQTYASKPKAPAGDAGNPYTPKTKEQFEALKAQNRGKTFYYVGPSGRPMKVSVPS